jgi:hypothetical protein
MPAGSEARLLGPQAARTKPSAIGVFVIALAAVLALQYFHGAYSASIASYPDEPGHVVTALMYRQFLLAPTADPLQFAKNYYSHYPYVAAGHWPPVLHLSAAVWTLLAGAGKTQFILYLALAGAAAAALLYRSILTIGSAWLAAAFVAIWMMLAQSQATFTRFMTEAPLALLTLAAVVVYVRYLRTPSYRLSLLFAGLSAAAILTKETAVALAFVPPLAVAATQQWKLLRKGHFWMPAPLVLVLVGPWHLWVAGLTVGRYRGGVLERVMIHGETPAAHRLALFVVLLGWPLLLLATYGLLVRMARIKQECDSAPLWAAHASLLAGGLAVLIVAPESEEVRHLYQLSPSFLLFAAAGAWSLTQHVQRSIRTSAAVLVGLSCILLSPVNFSRKTKTSVALIDPLLVAGFLHSEPDAQIVLLSANGHISEGPLIAEMAILEPEPVRFLVRASKTIYATGWDARSYRPAISALPDLRNFIDSSGIDTIVRLGGEARPQRTDEALLSLAIAEQPADWALIPLDLPSGTRVYRRITANKTARQPIRIQMSTRLGEDLVLKPATVSPKASR